jgi:hypothetical protein
MLFTPLSDRLWLSVAREDPLLSIIPCHVLRRTESRHLGIDALNLDFIASAFACKDPADVVDGLDLLHASVDHALHPIYY